MNGIKGPADFRADIARYNVVKYRLAARAGMHPCTLVQLLNGKRQLTPEIAERLERAIVEEARAE